MCNAFKYRIYIYVLLNIYHSFIIRYPSEEVNTYFKYFLIAISFNRALRGCERSELLRGLLFLLFYYFTSFYYFNYYFIYILLCDESGIFAIFVLQIGHFQSTIWHICHFQSTIWQICQFVLLVSHFQSKLANMPFLYFINSNRYIS